MTDGLRKCTVCNGRGYTRCDCWPGDCICGWDEEDCEFCDGTGYFEPDEDDFYTPPTHPTEQE